jgi:hypothetical protein
MPVREWMYRPTFLDLGTSWRWVVSFTPRPLNPRGKKPGTLWIWGWVSPRVGLDDMENWKFLLPSELERRPLGRTARSQSLYRLSYPGSSLISSRPINQLLHKKPVFCIRLIARYWSPSSAKGGQFSGQRERRTWQSCTTIKQRRKLSTQKYRYACNLITESHCVMDEEGSSHVRKCHISLIKCGYPPHLIRQCT